MAKHSRHDDEDTLVAERDAPEQFRGQRSNGDGFKPDAADPAFPMSPPARRPIEWRGVWPSEHAADADRRRRA